MSNSASAFANPAENSDAATVGTSLITLQHAVAWSAALILLTAAVLKA